MHWVWQGRRCRQPAPNSATSAGASGDRGAAAACSETLLWASLLGPWLSRGRRRGSFVAPGPPGHASHFRSHGPLDLNRGGTPRSEGSAQNRPQRQPHLAVWSARAGPPTPAAPAVKLREDKAGGCWGRVLQGSPRGPLSASSQNQLFVGTIY